MEKVEISTEFIKLDQFLKWTGLCDTGAEAKMEILEGKVKVNGVTETQRGKKLRKGDTIEHQGKIFVIE